MASLSIAHPKWTAEAVENYYNNVCPTKIKNEAPADIAKNWNGYTVDEVVTACKKRYGIAPPVPKAESPPFEVIQKFLSCDGRFPKLKGICALTLAVDKGSLCGTFIFDWDKQKMLRHYPARYNSNSPKYVDIGDTSWTVNLAVGLPPQQQTGKKTGGDEDPSCFPFCCKNAEKSSSRRLTDDCEFRKFKGSKGTSRYIFRVVKKIQYGSLEKIGFYTLKGGKVEEIQRTESEHKRNTFKIYTCDTHNTYYSVNLMTLESTHNYHHAKGQNETEYGPKIIEAMKKSISKT